MHVGTTHKVTIDLATLKVFPDPVVLSKTNEEDLDWLTTSDDATVIFKTNGTPFNAEQFEVPKGKTKNSGALNSAGLRICNKCTPNQHQPGHPEHYKYEVWSHGVMKMDPEIIIVR